VRKLPRLTRSPLKPPDKPSQRRSSRPLTPLLGRLGNGKTPPAEECPHSFSGGLVRCVSPSSSPPQLRPKMVPCNLGSSISVPTAPHLGPEIASTSRAPRPWSLLLTSLAVLPRRIFFPATPPSPPRPSTHNGPAGVALTNTVWASKTHNNRQNLKGHTQSFAGEIPHCLSHKMIWPTQTADAPARTAIQSFQISNPSQA
jgi:hypothetical protein